MKLARIDITPEQQHDQPDQQDQRRRAAHRAPAITSYRIVLKPQLVVAAVAGLALLVLLAAAVLSQRTPDSARPDTAVAPPSPSGAAASPSTAAAPDGQEDVHDGDEPTAPAQPAPVPSTKPTAVQAATAFAGAWLNTTGRTAAQWRHNLDPMVTDEVRAQLADVDPEGSIPTGRVGEQDPTSVVTGDGLATVVVTVVDSQRRKVGELTLGMNGTGGTWLVGSIDWTATS